MLYQTQHFPCVCTTMYSVQFNITEKLKHVIVIMQGQLLKYILTAS